MAALPAGKPFRKLFQTTKGAGRLGRVRSRWRARPTASASASGSAATGGEIAQPNHRRICARHWAPAPGILVCFRNSFTYNARCLPHPPAHVKAYPLPTSFKHPTWSISQSPRRLVASLAARRGFPDTPARQANAEDDRGSDLAGEPGAVRAEPRDRAVPLVGALIGLVAGLALLGAFQLGLHPLACAFIALATSIAPARCTRTGWATSPMASAAPRARIGWRSCVTTGSAPSARWPCCSGSAFAPRSSAA